MAILCRFIIIVFLVLTSGLTSAEVIKKDAPYNYIVKKGDSLWDIANMYLDSPWMWPQVWQTNSGIKNSDLIFPEDCIKLEYDNGKPKIYVSKRGKIGRVIRLSPHVRVDPSENAIPTIPRSKIETMISQNTIFETEDKNKVFPKIDSIDNNKTVAFTGDKIFVTGDVKLDKTYKVYRKGDVLKNPITSEVLGIVGHNIGEVQVEQQQGKYSQCKILKNNKEIKPGDILLADSTDKITTMFNPKSPEPQVNSVILSGLQDKSKFSRNDSVIIGKGKQDGLTEGDILTVYRQQENRNIPLISCGLIMIYKIYEKVSFALVLSSNQPINKDFLVKNPKKKSL
jgi:hypothetical protein